MKENYKMPGNKSVTVCDGWSVEPFDSHTFRINQSVGNGVAFGYNVLYKDNPPLFAFLKALHAEHYEPEEEE
jgi:hypothetical protein